MKNKEFDYLLNNYWCCRENDPKLYFDIKNNLDYYKDFIQKSLGSKLVVNDRFIKLEKIPAVPKSYMGIMEFTDTLEYIILFIVLLYLEDKPKGEQFILSYLTDYVLSTSKGLKLDNVVDWNIQHHRKCLVNVINHLIELNIIKLVEEKNLFTDDILAEALYESTGLANYFVRSFNGDITKYSELKDFITDEFYNQEQDIGIVRRNYVYRQLLYSLVFYSEDMTEAQIDYLRKNRVNINDTIEKYTNSSLELTKNMGLLFYEDGVNNSLYFPNNKGIADISLLINNKILSLIEKNELELDDKELVIVQSHNLKRIIKDVRNEYLEYFGKKYRDLVVDKFLKEVIDYMLEYDFISYDSIHDSYKIKPMVGRLVGSINKADEQINIFNGGQNE